MATQLCARRAGATSDSSRASCAKPQQVVDPNGSADASYVWPFVGGEDAPVVLVRESERIC